MFAIVVIALAGGAVAAAQVPEGKARLGKVGPAIEKQVGKATGGRFDPRNYTYDRRGRPTAFSRIH